MANEIRITTSVDVLQDVGGSAGAQSGITYTNHQYDGNADSRSWGGSYKIATEYTDADVCYWKNAVVSATSADGLNNSGWTEASDVSDGAIPTTAHVVAVEYVSTLGTVASVSVTINSEIHAVLLQGESVVIPLAAGEAVANVKVHASAYSNGVHEATVNVMMAGV
tara:strand:- start:28495 stop:28992 length:498 start_codon:yes stop_codon:yes gene_type:complete